MSGDALGRCGSCERPMHEGTLLFLFQGIGLGPDDDPRLTGGGFCVRPLAVFCSPVCLGRYVLTMLEDRARARGLEVEDDG